MKPILPESLITPAGKPDVLRMCMRQNRDLSFESEAEQIEDPVCRMREPPGALGDIVRRMKRRAGLRRVGLPTAALHDANAAGRPDVVCLPVNSPAAC